MLQREGVFSRLPVLQTERLVLRKITMADVQDIFAYSSDPRVSRYVLWETHHTVSDARNFVRYMQRLYRSGAPASWAIECKADGRVIGTVGFMWWNREHNSAEVGYSLASRYWNHGYATEALREILRFGFAEMRLQRIEAQHELENPASGRVMAKAGMRREGLLRKRLYNKGRYVDVELYAILREDMFGVGR